MSCVKDQIVNTIRQRVAQGESVDAVAWDAVKTHLNIERAGVNTDVQGVLKFMTEIMDRFTQNAKGGVRSYQQTLQLARESAALHGRAEFADSLVKTAANIKDLEATLLGARIYRNQVAEELDNLVKRARTGDTAAQAQIPELVAEALKVHQATDMIQTASARSVSQGNIVAGSKMDWGRVAKAAQEAVTGDGFDTRRFLAQLDLAGGSAESQINVLKKFQAAGAPSGLLARLLSIHNEIWINGILGSATTHSANFIANSLNTFLQPVLKVTGGVLSMNPAVVRRGVRDAMGLAQAVADVFDLTHRASKIGIDSTAAAVGKSLRNETPVLDQLFKASDGGPLHAITKENLGLENAPVIGGLVDAAGKLIRMPTRLLTASDEAFKQINYRVAVRGQAMEEAEKLGLLSPGRQNELTAYVDDYMKNAFDASGLATNERALLAAQQTTFTNDLVGRLSRDLSRFIGKHPALRPIVPFVRTPINIMREFWQYTPGLNLLQQEFRHNLVHSDPLIKATARAKLALGSAATYLLFNAANNGTVTGGGPAEPKQREALMATGWRPYSFVLQNDDGTKSYIDYRRLDPAATLIGLVADVAEISHHLDDPDYHGLFTGISMSLSQNITNRTYLRGLSELTTVLGSRDPNAVQKVINDRIGSYVPGYVASMNSDPNMHDIRTWTDAIRRRVPGYSQSLPPRRDMFGDVMTVPVGYAIDGEPENGVPRISPFGYSKRIGDPVKEEMANVSMNTPGGDHGFDKPPKSMSGLDLTKFTNADGQDAYDRYLQLHGEVTIKGKKLPEALDRMINSSYYQNLPEPQESDARLNALRTVFATYREQARKTLVNEFPEIKDYIDAVNKAHRQQQAPSIARLLNF